MKQVCLHDVVSLAPQKSRQMHYLAWQRDQVRVASEVEVGDVYWDPRFAKKIYKIASLSVQNDRDIVMISVTQVAKLLVNPDSPFRSCCDVANFAGLHRQPKGRQRD